MQSLFLTLTGLLALVVLVASFKKVLSRKFPFLKDLEPTTRDAYLVLAVFAGIALFLSGHIQSLEIGGVARLTKVENTIADLSKQIERLYKARIMEVFDSADSPRIRFEKRPDWGFTVEITLAKHPLQQSLEITRGATTVSPTDVTVEGNKLRFLTYSNEFRHDPIVVRYYSAPERTSP
jgi:hypothetical protein